MPFSNVTVYAMSPQKVTNGLQRAMNAAARVVSVTGKFDVDCSIGWMFLRGLSTSLVARHTAGVCKNGHLATLQTTSSQPLILLLAVVVYDLLTSTVSLCLLSTQHSGCRAFHSAGRSGSFLIVLNGSWKQFSLAATSMTSALDVIYNEMRYINLRLLHSTPEMRASIITVHALLLFSIQFQTVVKQDT